MESAGSNSSCSSNVPPKTLSEMVRVKSFSYKSITVAYGDSYDAFVVLRYSAEKKSFILSFGMSGEGVWATNPHTMMQDNLQDLVNQRGHMGLVELAITLHHTYHPLLAISKLSPTIHLGVIDKQQQPIKNFTILVQSPTRVSIIYRNVYCLNVDMLTNGLVAVRDGAFSSFETSKLIEEFIPVQGLKAFLSKYVDESAIRRRSQSEDDNPPTPIPIDDTPWPTPKAASPARHGPMTPPISSNPHTPASPHPGGINQPSGHSGFVSSPATSGFSLASPPPLPGMNPSPAMLPHQSPGGGFLGANSPSAPQHGVASPGAFLVPSPAAPHSVPMHSPASAFMQGPIGPMSSYTSRVLPSKPYAAAVPTTLTHDAFYTLCSPAQIDEGGDNSLQCLVEQFLGMTYLKRHFQQLCRGCEGIKPVGDVEPGSIQFKTDTLNCQMLVQSSPAYTLSLKLQPLPEHGDQWTSDELQVLEKFFTVKVLVPPFRPYAVQSFYSILKFQCRVLKDCIRIMQLELMPTPQQQQQMKWNIQWCLTNPPIGPQIAPPGLYVVVVSRNKILFFLQLTKANVQLPPDTEPPNLMLPVVYDSTSNKTQMAERREQSNVQSVTLQVINEIMSRAVVQQNELSLFPCIRELLCNLSLGPDGNVVAAPATPVSQSTSTSSGGGTVPPSLTSPHLTSPHMSSPVTPGSSNASAGGQSSLSSSMSPGMMSSGTGTGTTNVSALSSPSMMSNMSSGSHFSVPKSGGGHMPQTMSSMGSLGPQGPMQNIQTGMNTMSGIQSNHMQQSMAGGIMQQQGTQRGMQGGPTTVQGGPNTVGSGNMQGMASMQGGGMQSLSGMQGGPGGLQGGPGGMQTGPGSMQGGPGGMQGGPGGMQGGPGGMQSGFGSGIMGNQFNRNM